LTNVRSTPIGFRVLCICLLVNKLPTWPSPLPPRTHTSSQTYLSGTPPTSGPREAHIRLQMVLVLRHVDQLLRVQHAGRDEIFPNGPAVRDQFRTEQIDPLAVRRMRHLAFVAAVAAEQLAVEGHVEVDRPLVPLQVIPGPRARLHVVAGQPEDFAARGCRSCQIVFPSALQNS
jgi:hypothetical protein